MASENPTTITRSWVVETRRRLFYPARKITVHASSRYEAECLVRALLEPGEWFPSFTAIALAEPTKEAAA